MNENEQVSRVGRYRWVICALLFFATTVNYVDRQVIGVLAPSLGKEIGWDEKQYANIVISFQAAYAAPIIMMSQNRQAAKDRLAAEIDHQVNTKAELEIGLVLRRLEDLERRLSARGK